MERDVRQTDAIAVEEPPVTAPAHRGTDRGRASFHIAPPRRTYALVAAATAALLAVGLLVPLLFASPVRPADDFERERYDGDITINTDTDTDTDDDTDTNDPAPQEDTDQGAPASE